MNKLKQLKDSLWYDDYNRCFKLDRAKGHIPIKELSTNDLIVLLLDKMLNKKMSYIDVERFVKLGESFYGYRHQAKTYTREFRRMIADGKLQEYFRYTVINERPLQFRVNKLRLK